MRDFLLVALGFTCTVTISELANENWPIGVFFTLLSLFLFLAIHYKPEQ